MSHTVTVSTEIRDLGILKKVLEEQNFCYYEQQAKIYDYYNRATPVDIALEIDGKRRMGFRKNADAYEIVGDFYGSNKKCEEIIKTITVQYAKNKTIKELRARNFRIVQDVEEGGNIVLRARRWSA